MKTRNCIAAVFICVVSASAYAEDLYDYGEPVQGPSMNEASLIGFATVLGGVLGGPVTAIAGGVGGAIQTSLNRSEKSVVVLKTQLSHVQAQVVALRQTNRHLTKTLHVQKVALTRDKRLHLNKGISMSVQFRQDSHLLEPAFVKQITELANSFSTVNQLHIYLTGHADRQGGDRYNQLLSEQRVKSVARVLCRAGWPKQRMHIKAYGETRPLSKIGDKSAYAFDRRVNVLLTTNGGGV